MLNPLKTLAGHAGAGKAHPASAPPDPGPVGEGTRVWTGQTQTPGLSHCQVGKGRRRAQQAYGAPHSPGGHSLQSAGPRGPQGDGAHPTRHTVPGTCPPRLACGADGPRPAPPQPSGGSGAVSLSRLDAAHRARRTLGVAGGHFPGQQVLRDPGGCLQALARGGSRQHVAGEAAHGTHRPAPAPREQQSGMALGKGRCGPGDPRGLRGPQLTWGSDPDVTPWPVTAWKPKGQRPRERPGGQRAEGTQWSALSRGP